MSDLSHPDTLYRIALNMIPKVGPVLARRMLKAFGSAEAVFRAGRTSLLEIPGMGPGAASNISGATLMQQAENELSFIKKHRIGLLYLEDADYPARLKECYDAPVILYVRGDLGLHAMKMLSVVGTRRASSYGKEVCRKIVLELGHLFPDICIVSGLAYGIDVIAHRASLEAGVPTLAVLGHGFSTLYPASHRETARAITQQGALLSDFYSTTGPERNNFLRRNRIIAGLSDATLVVESAGKGGALITAHLASGYSRDVLAIPGRVGDNRSEGCNKIIKENIAALVESAGDIARHLNWENKSAAGPDQPGIKPEKDEKELLLHLLERSPRDPGELSLLCGMDVGRVISLLTTMELKAWIKKEPGNRFSPALGIHVV